MCGLPVCMYDLCDTACKNKLPPFFFFNYILPTCSSYLPFSSTHLYYMGQASSSPNSLGFFKKNPLTNEYEDMSNKFTKATMSTLAVPVIIVAYPVLNAYTFQDSDITGYRIVDGAIGGVLGVIGCKYWDGLHLHWYVIHRHTGPLAPVMAIWGAIQINFK